MNVSIVGAGYVGLVTGACLAETGHTVVCVDVDPRKVDAINRAQPPFHEPGLEDLLKRHAGKALSATADLDAAVKASEVTLIAVGTPFGGKRIDLRFIEETAAQIGRALARKNAYHTVVVKSTVLPGTTDDIVRPLLEGVSGKRAGEHFGVGMNPEFLSEGEAVADAMHPDRIVLGGMDERTIEAQDRLYRGFESAPRVRTNNRTAEMIKYASNALQATMISFANQIANLCSGFRSPTGEGGEIDAMDVMHAVHLMKELNPRPTAGSSPGQPVRAGITSFLSPGCGFGGSCFPKDLKALAAHAEEFRLDDRLLRAVLDINADQPHRVAQLLTDGLGGSLTGRTIAVLGLAFKPNTDDIRETPALPIIQDLLEAGAHVRAYDPLAMSNARPLLGEKVKLCRTLNAAIDGAAAIVIATRWDEFRALPDLLRSSEKQPLVVDGRRMLDRRSVERYVGIGL